MRKRIPKRNARRALVIFPLILLPMILVAKVYTGPLSIVAAIAAGALTAVLLSRRRGLQVVDEIVAWIEDGSEDEPDIYPPPGRAETLLTYAGAVGLIVCVLLPPLRENDWSIAPLVLFLAAMWRQRDRENTAALNLHAEREILRDRLARGLTVAEYWRDGVMSEGRRELEVPYRTMAHPLACAISALTGEETEPDQMGITGVEFARRFPKTLEQLDELVRIEREGLPAEPAEPCWTGTVDGALCHRGGIGCPRPHAEDAPELRRTEPRRLMAYDPLHPER